MKHYSEANGEKAAHVSVESLFERAPAGPLLQRSHNALDYLNFFLADVQTGFGPFVAVYLTTQHWTEASIGFALSVGTIASMVSQMPAGVLVDTVRQKRIMAAWGIVGVGCAALLLLFWPTGLSVMVAEVLHGLASSILTPVIVAISLGVVGSATLGARLGRNAAFAAAGNGIAAAVMGAAGSWVGSSAVMWLTAALTMPALASLAMIGPISIGDQSTQRAGVDWSGLVQLFTDRRLVVFAVSVILFHLSNAAMLPLAAAQVTKQSGDFANLVVAVAIMVPQAVVVLTSSRIGERADRWGRRPILLLGWSALPVRALLFALLPNPWLLVAWQSISGISAAVFGVMMALIAADLTRGSKHFNLCIGFLGLCTAGGATMSTAMGGWIANAADNTVAFLTLAAVGLAGTVLLWAAMPETIEKPETINAKPLRSKNETGS